MESIKGHNSWLLIEDDPDDQEIFISTLKTITNDIDCTVSSSATEALQRIKTDATFTPGYIFVDINLPVVDGFQCIEEIKKIRRLKESQLIVYTTSNIRADKERAETAGAKFIAKQTSFANLSAFLKECATESILKDKTEFSENILSIENRDSQKYEELLNSFHTKINSLKSRNNFIEAIFDASTCVMCVYDTETRIIYFNKEAEEYFDLKRKNVIGKKHIEVFPKSAGTQAEHDLARALKGEYIHNKTFRSLYIDKVFENFLIPLKDEDEQVYAVLTIANDITDIIQLTEELTKANELLQEKNFQLRQVNKDLEEFAHAVSHDLLEPVRKVEYFVSALKEKVAGVEASDLMRRILRTTQRMAHLIHSVLTYSRLSAHEMLFENVNLNSILQQVINDYDLKIKDKNAQIILDELPVIQGISIQFTQLFSNLLSNALKFSSSEPVIKISTREASKEESETIGGSDEKYFCIEAKDNGIGFDNENAGRVFKMFEKLHPSHIYPGSGIGLAICKKVVENHNGFIRASGDPGKGATFQIFLPLSILRR